MQESSLWKMDLTLSSASGNHLVLMQVWLIDTEYTL